VDFLTLIIALAVLLAAATVALVVSWLLRPHETAAWASARMDYFLRLWEFWGPRLTDRGFVGAIFANGAVLGFLAIDPEKAQLWQFIVWGAANLFFPLWDNHPAGEKVLRSRQIGLEFETISSETPEERDARTEAIVDRVIKRYASAGAH
jgi:hypothetical protein